MLNFESKIRFWKEVNLSKELIFVVLVFEVEKVYVLFVVIIFLKLCEIFFFFWLFESENRYGICYIFISVLRFYDLGRL